VAKDRKLERLIERHAAETTDFVGTCTELWGAAKPRRLTGRCSNGAERDGGRLYHAVPDAGYPNFARALCGAKPGRLSSGWDDDSEGAEVTCKRCVRKLAALP
jgi:hypothetical protein